MKKVIWIILLILIGLQFIPVDKPQVTGNNPNDLLSVVSVPDTVADILKNSCYDCHSNQTIYPWYSHVAPVSWLVAKDVREGREHVNFSNWQVLELTKKAEHLENMIDEIKDGEMPMSIYTAIHQDARLSEEQQKLIIDWINDYGNSLFE
ncbi:MAG: heme-binding domain-containing protein [Flavobacteriaceae bacterium]|nr:heme-binding domain-containing protein [Flavobacteriaceae bacterium]